jgi:hypothetical protein
MLAERFGGSPFVYMDAPMDQLLGLINLLAVEGQVASLYRSLGAEDSLVLPDGWADDEDDPIWTTG